MENPRERIREIEKRLAQLPKGTLTTRRSMAKNSHMCRGQLMAAQSVIMSKCRSGRRS